MKRTLTAIFAMSLGVMVTSCGDDSRTVSKPLDDSVIVDQSICSIVGLPDGWVVVAHSTTGQCPGHGGSADFWNTYVIRRAGTTETVCRESPIPNGYMRVAPRRAIDCVIPLFTSADYTNAFEIRRL